MSQPSLDVASIPPWIGGNQNGRGAIICRFENVGLRTDHNYFFNRVVIVLWVKKYPWTRGRSGIGCLACFDIELYRTSSSYLQATTRHANTPIVVTGLNGLFAGPRKQSILCQAIFQVLVTLGHSQRCRTTTPFVTYAPLSNAHSLHHHTFVLMIFSASVAASGGCTIQASKGRKPSCRKCFTRAKTHGWCTLPCCTRNSRSPNTDICPKFWQNLTWDSSRTCTCRGLWLEFWWRYKWFDKTGVVVPIDLRSDQPPSLQIHKESRAFPLSTLQFQQNHLGSLDETLFP